MRNFWISLLLFGLVAVGYDTYRERSGRSVTAAPTSTEANGQVTSQEDGTGFGPLGTGR